MRCWILCTDIWQANNCFPGEKKLRLKRRKNSGNIKKETMESGYLGIWALFVFIAWMS